MLTRCPGCKTHFRVTVDQIKARSGRVRCGECGHAFNALDSLIEEPMAVRGRPATNSQRQGPLASVHDAVGEARRPTEGELHEVAVNCPPSEASSMQSEPPPARYVPSETHESIPDAREQCATLPHEEEQAPIPEPAELDKREPVEAEAAEPVESDAQAAEPEIVHAEAVDPDIAAADAASDWAKTLPEPPRAPRRWPWVIGSVVALIALGLQVVLTFRVELAVLWPEAKPALVALCGIVGCEVGLPAKVALVGIEGSDLHPDSEHPGRLALTATLKSRAPFAQQFPHLELTLTDTADKAIVRKVLAPADYLPPQTSVAQGMPSNADIMVTVGVDSGAVAASGYRLYLFYP